MIIGMVSSTDTPLWQKLLPLCTNSRSGLLSHQGMKAKLSPFIAPVTVNNSRIVIGNENGNLEFHEYVHYEMYIQNSLKHDRNTNVCKTQTRQCCHLTKILEF